MPGTVSDRAAGYRKQAEHFRSLAKMEQEPLARARLLGLADQYVQLADTGPQKPTAHLLDTRARNKEVAGTISPADE